jgi:hypothetical protein
MDTDDYYKQKEINNNQPSDMHVLQTQWGRYAFCCDGINRSLLDYDQYLIFTLYHYCF